jgi:mycothiol S-conjugate amidase
LIDYTPVKELKTEASICHASQGGSGMIRGLMGWMVRLAGARETFMRASPPPEPHLRERDLFAGIRGG